MRSREATEKDMRMNRFLIAICTAPILFGIPLADAASCKYQTQSVDPVTNEKFVQTKWDKVATMFSGGKSIGSISAIARGDERYLAVKIGVLDYYPFPDELRAEAVATMNEKTLKKYRKRGAVGQYKAEIKQLERPPENQNYRDFLDFLLGESLIIPAGSTLRLTLDDNSTLMLSTTERIRERANYTQPYKEKKMKGFGGFLAKAASAALDAETVVSSDYMVDGYISIDYLLDTEALDLLSRAAVTSLRVEARNKYYTLGTRSTQYETVRWSKKSNLKIQNALKCVE